MLALLLWVFSLNLDGNCSVEGIGTNAEKGTGNSIAAAAVGTRSSSIKGTARGIKTTTTIVASKAKFTAADVRVAVAMPYKDFSCSAAGHHHQSPHR